MKNNMGKILTVFVILIIMCMNISVFATAVPQKTESTGSQDKYSSDIQKIINTAKENETKKDKDSDSENSPEDSETSKATTSPKASEKTQATTSPKATETQKATASPKTTKTPKATEKNTKKTESTDKTTVSTIKPEKSEETENEEFEENVIVVDENEPEPTLNVVKNPEQINANRYLTKGGAFGMFLLTVLVSAIISFLISYRFYKMHRSDSHIAAEIRALKRDIDTKMAATVGGFSEYETKTSNSNPSFAGNGHPIRVERNEEVPTESDDVLYSKWETQINSSEGEKKETRAGRQELRSRSERYSKARKEKSTTDKIKGAIGEIFSKKK